MCLYVDTNIHPIAIQSKSKRRGSRCRIAAQHILVYKLLRKSDEKGGFAPFRDCRWTFGETRTAKGMRVNTDTRSTAVYYGLHAHTTKSKAHDSSAFVWNTTVHPAIIPKGSRVFFGENIDVVATEMVVFKDMESLIAVYGKPGKAKRKKTLTNPN